MPNTPILASPSSSAISPLARDIARGLKRSGRVTNLRAALAGYGDDEERWITLPTRRSEFYFLSVAGDELRRGIDWLSSDRLQDGFVEVMARLGASA